MIINMKFYHHCLYLLFFALLQSCNSVSISPASSAITSNTIISGTSAVTSILSLDKNNNFTICTQPYADAGLSDSDSVSLNFNVLNFGDKGGSNSEESSVADIEFEGRTPVLLLARELLYRQCEFNYNYKLSYDDALKLYKKNIDIIAKLAEAEVKNTKISISETLLSQINESNASVATINSKSSYDNSSANDDKKSNSDSDSDSDSDSSSDSSGLSPSDLSDDLSNQVSDPDNVIQL